MDAVERVPHLMGVNSERRPISRSAEDIGFAMVNFELGPDESFSRALHKHFSREEKSERVEAMDENRILTLEKTIDETKKQIEHLTADRSENASEQDRLHARKGEIQSKRSELEFVVEACLMVSLNASDIRRLQLAPPSVTHQSPVIV